jgi:NAD-dependent deacetylase
MDRIFEELDQCTMLMVVGSSGTVHPAASFVQQARRSGARTVYVGPERPSNAGMFTDVVLGKAGEVLPSLFRVSKSS